MTAPLLYAANWKMHLGPMAAVRFLEEWLPRVEPRSDREVWFFPSAVALEAVAGAIKGRPDVRVGAQNVHWAPKGAYTGELSVAMAAEAGATAALVGHSERRHVFGETDGETAKKVGALLEHGLVPVLCVGEKLEERDAGETLDVVFRQLNALAGIAVADLRELVIAYEPVWAIGTGRNATPNDAALVHAAIRRWFRDHGLQERIRVLYGGSVKPDNAGELVSEPEIDGVLVGGASLEPASWVEIVHAGL
jgi:triosephosphate isomerase